MIMAADRNWGIGNRGGLLCHLPGDMKFFRETTKGKTVVMGRATLESLPGAKGLPGRRNIVLTTREGYTAENAEVVHDEEALFRALEGTDPDEVFVIGGARVYRDLLPHCDTLYITKIDHAFPADRFFVNIDEMPEFRMAEESGIREENGFRYRFVRYERV